MALLRQRVYTGVGGDDSQGTLGTDVTGAGDDSAVVIVAF